eukprot:NODE_2072_length_2299_cov_13.219613.p1 GENE.NODE_2072_length_2299_cov_13.219613~~NODE_2072_length_2299_cov_13.219613.p1  ORF type:complete len:640 (-),score=255.57 NODE_2072_length_2299_cov_13.219613:255-2174(-)
MCIRGSINAEYMGTGANMKGPQVASGIGAGESEGARLVQEIKEHKADRDGAKASMAEATTVREKEAAAFAASKDESNTNIAALTKAIGQLEAGTKGSLLQTDTAQVLQHLLAARQDVQDMDRQTIMSFLSGTQAATYAPQSGEITGILKQLSDDMKAELKENIAKEQESISTYTALMAAKNKEVSVLTGAIEEKMERAGKLGVDVATLKNDLEDSQEALAEDKKFLADLEKNCAAKAAEWGERKKVRAEEIRAIAETIKVLNDDDALELFKKRLPSPSASFVQLTKAKDMAAQALRILRTLPRADDRGVRPELNFLAVALQGKAANFGVVIRKIDDMIAVMKKEQVSDLEKKEYCEAKFDTSDDKKKSLERTVSGLAKELEEAKDALETTTAEIKALQETIAALDKEVQEAREQRDEEHNDFTDLIAADSAAKKLLEFAKNRLNQFYNAGLYKAAPKLELSKEQRISVSMGGEAQPTVAPSGIAGTGIAVLQKGAPAPPPETFDAYQNKHEESTGVIEMLDLLVRDLEKEMTEARTAEEHAQVAYEEFLVDAKAKRRQDAKTLDLKDATKARFEEDIAAGADTKAGKEAELADTNKYIAALHSECDWTLQHFDARKEARNNEIDQLTEAKAVLNGADYA